MRIIHFSDIHVWLKTPGMDLYPRRILGLANLLLVRARSFPRDIQQRVCARIAADQADSVLFSGDLTCTSQIGEFQYGRRMMEPLFEKYGKSLIAIPGNHDVYTPYAQRKQHFEKWFLQYHQPTVFCRTLNDELSVIGIDCSFPQKLYARGKITDRQLDQVRKLLDQEEQQGRSVMILCHYPIAFPPSKELELKCSHSHGLIGDYKLRDLINRKPVIAYLNGHLHVRWAMRMGQVININSGAAGKLGADLKNAPGYVRFDVEDSEVSNLTCVTLKAPDYREWQETPLEIETRYTMTNGSLTTRSRLKAMAFRKFAPDSSRT